MREEKQLLLDEIHGLTEKHGSFVIIRYEGLSANRLSDFRNEIVSLGGEVEMVPKRLLCKVAEQGGFPLNIKDLPGHIGLILSGHDAVETTKRTFEFSKSTENAIQVIGGRFDGALLSGQDVEKLSKLPALPQMRAELLATFEAPLSETLGVMNAILTCVVNCIQQKSEKIESGE